MNKRICDFCGEDIPRREKFGKICVSEMIENQKQKLTHVADICLTCLGAYSRKKIKNERGK